MIMKFIKGHIPWCKGTKGVMKPNTTSFKKGMVPHNKGKRGLYKHTEKWKNERHFASIGEKNPFYSRKHTEKTKVILRLKNSKHRHTEEAKEKIGIASRNLIRTESHKRNISIAQKKRYDRILGIGKRLTPEQQALRNSPEYKNWRKDVLKRDDYTCQNCKKRGGVLNADHIKPFSRYPELRFEISNGRTLCKPCHIKIGWSLFRVANPMRKTILT